MGCGASHTAHTWLDTGYDDGSGYYVEYKGRGTDYTNYDSYDQYHRQGGINTNLQSHQEAWQEYYRYQQYQKSLGENPDQSIPAVTPAGKEQDDIDALSEYQQWCNGYPAKQVKQDIEDKSTVDLKIEESVTDTAPEDGVDEVDCAVEEPNKRFGLKTLSTALRITVVKQKEAQPEPGLLNVSVLDTMKNQSADFVVKKPKVLKGQVFVDNEFTKAKALGKKYSKFQWKRPKDIYPKAKISLFHEGTSLDDVDQGQFGTCYLLAVLSGLATMPHIMKQLIMPDAYNPKTGLFHCRFWKFGRWIDVYTDDCLPVEDGQIAGCKSNDDGEMWVPLLEKAYAKFIGSYPAIEGGAPREAYLHLTGGCAEWLALSYYEFDPAKVYSRIANALIHGSVVVASSTPTDDFKTKKYESKGMVMNHAYTITATAVVEREGRKSESLIKLRNPWSHKEWTGAWGDNSSEWYSVDKTQRAQLREIEDNGEFWMPWNKFWDIFTDITVCSITPDYDSDGIGDGLDNVFCIYGQWKGPEWTGGWKTTHNNPKFSFKNPENSDKLLVEMLSSIPPKAKKATAGNLLVKDLGNHEGFMGANANTYTTANPVTRRFELEAGHEYQITPTKYETGDEARFLLRVFSQQPLQIKPWKPKD